MNLAALVLLALVFGIVAFDWITARGKNRRALWLEVVAFIAGGFFIAFPQRATDLAHLVGIGRGVDFLLYPIVIWLVRESLASRRRRIEDAETITKLVRALAVAEARVHSGESITR
jgi:small membrane protein